MYAFYPTLCRLEDASENTLVQSSTIALEPTECPASCTPEECNDDNACTNDTCDPNLGCVFTDLDCDDDNACTNDSCNPTAGCTYSAVNCDDSNACTDDDCSPSEGCTYQDATCDDTNVCTADSCNPAIGCVFTPDPPGVRAGGHR